MSQDAEKEPEYVEIPEMPGTRFRVDRETSADEGYLWLRPAFVALRVKKERVKPWDNSRVWG